MFLEEINLNFIQPCTTDSKRIRIIATPSKDVSELFPYLNTYLNTCLILVKILSFVLIFLSI